jgi:hypothetical protein
LDRTPLRVFPLLFFPKKGKLCLLFFANIPRQKVGFYFLPLPI